MSSIFTKIINRQIPATILYETEHLIAIKDIHPVAPVHVLIIPKKEIQGLQSVGIEDAELINDMIRAAQMLAKQLKIDQTGYRLITNQGSDAGQEINHLHFHLIGGKELGCMA
jgi:histidine triad (HIT) family protein